MRSTYLVTFLVVSLSVVALARQSPVLKRSKMGVSVVLRRIVPGRTVKDHYIGATDRLTYTLDGKTAVLDLPDIWDPLGDTEIILQPADGPAKFPLVVLSYHDDDSRDIVFSPGFIEYDGRALHRLPQLELQPANGGTPDSDSKIQTFRLGILLYHVDVGHSLQPYTSTERLRYRLVSLADGSHVIMCTRTLLGAQSLESPVETGPQKEIQWLNVPLRHWKTDNGLQILVPAKP